MNVTSSSRSSGKRGPRLARRAPTPPSGSGSGFFGWLRALALRGLATGPETNSAFITSCFSLPRNRNAGCDTTSDQDPPACRSAQPPAPSRAPKPPAHGGARRRRRRRRRRVGDGAPDSLCSDREPLADHPVLRDLKPARPRASARRPSPAPTARGSRSAPPPPPAPAPRIVPQAHQPLACMLRRRWSRVPVFAFEVAMRRSTHRSCIGRSWRVDVVATARRRVRFRSISGFARPSGRRVFAGALGAVTRDARDRGRARLRRARARNSPRTRGWPSARPPRPRVSPNATSRPSPRAPSLTRRATKTSRAPLRTAANRRAAPPAPGPHASAGLPLRCAPPRRSKTPPREVALPTRVPHNMRRAGGGARSNPARCRHQTGATTRTAPILFFSFPRGARKTRVALRRSFSNLSQKVATDYLLLLMRRIFPSEFLFSRGDRNVA